jgi:hypothetical protein
MGGPGTLAGTARRRACLVTVRDPPATRKPAPGIKIPNFQDLVNPATKKAPTNARARQPHLRAPGR